jgi:hypothetical protein
MLFPIDLRMDVSLQFMELGFPEKAQFRKKNRAAYSSESDKGTSQGGHP